MPSCFISTPAKNTNVSTIQKITIVLPKSFCNHPTNITVNSNKAPTSTQNSFLPNKFCSLRFLINPDRYNKIPSFSISTAWNPNPNPGIRIDRQAPKSQVTNGDPGNFPSSGINAHSTMLTIKIVLLIFCQNLYGNNQPNTNITILASTNSPWCKIK